MLTAAPRFLTLPFSEAQVYVGNGWFYQIDGPFDCGRCHKGIDYFLGTQSNGLTFQVLAAAPGRAVATYTSSFGYFVYIMHEEFDSGNRRYFTLYAHLREDTLAVPYKTRDEFLTDLSDRSFSGWATVSRGQRLGMAGKTGELSNSVHLHFEVQRGGYPLNKTDPYDLFDVAAIYPEPCGMDFLWTQCPPVFPPPPDGEYVLQPGPEGKDTAYGTVYARNGQPDDETLYYGGWGDWYYDYFEFDLTGSPSAANTSKAEFHVNVPSGITELNDPHLEVRRITESWTEAGVSFANNPSSVFYTNFGPVVSGWNIVDITDLYQGWKDGTYPNFGLKLHPTANNHTNSSFASSDNRDSAIRPKLVITRSIPFPE